MKIKGKKGDILIENVVFIILNFLFLTMLILFIARQGSGLIVLEQSYAKQIALLIDSAKPGMEIYLDMEDGFEKVREDWGEEHIKDTVQIKDNIIEVKLSPRSGYTYSFFNNNSKINYYPTYVIGEGTETRGYVFIFSK